MVATTASAATSAQPATKPHSKATSATKASVVNYPLQILSRSKSVYKQTSQLVQSQSIYVLAGVGVFIALPLLWTVPVILFLTGVASFWSLLVYGLWRGATVATQHTAVALEQTLELDFQKGYLHTIYETLIAVALKVDSVAETLLYPFRAAASILAGAVAAALALVLGPQSPVWVVIQFFQSIATWIWSQVLFVAQQVESFGLQVAPGVTKNISSLIQSLHSTIVSWIDYVQNQFSTLHFNQQ